jgi:hypothetical protein
MDISRTACTESGCHDVVWYRRLCRQHHAKKYPEEKIREYCFRWQLVEEFCGTVRAESREAARSLVAKGIVKGTREVTADHYPLPTAIECIKERS